MFEGDIQIVGMKWHYTSEIPSCRYMKKDSLVIFCVYTELILTQPHVQLTYFGETFNLGIFHPLTSSGCCSERFGPGRGNRSKRQEGEAVRRGGEVILEDGLP